MKKSEESPTNKFVAIFGIIKRNKNGGLELVLLPDIFTKFKNKSISFTVPPGMSCYQDSRKLEANKIVFIP